MALCKFEPDSGESSGRARTGLGVAYKVGPLSAVLGAAVPKALLDIDFIAAHAGNAEDLVGFFQSFVLQFCPTDPSDTELMTRFAKIGIGGRDGFQSRQAVARDKDGRRGRWRGRVAVFAGGVKQLDDGTVTSSDPFGTRPDRTTSISSGPSPRPLQPTLQRRPLGR